MGLSGIFKYPHDSGTSGPWIMVWETMVYVSDHGEKKSQNISLKYNKYRFHWNMLKHVLKNAEKFTNED